MPARLLECVPNFSEGRDLTVIKRSPKNKQDDETVEG